MCVRGEMFYLKKYCHVIHPVLRYKDEYYYDKLMQSMRMGALLRGGNVACIDGSI